jgi:hypothetical protein
MDTITLSKSELKDLVHDAVFETVADIFTDEDKFFNILDKIEDRNFGMLIEEGKKTEIIDRNEFRTFLKNKIQSL